MNDVTVRAIDQMRSYENRFYFAGLDLGVTAWGMNIIKMPPNWNDYPAHDHVSDGQEEVYVVLEGSATLEVGCEWLRLTPGTFAKVAPAAHRKLVAGDEGATVLALGAKPGEAYRYPDWLVETAAAAA